jgi:N-terminal domain of NWD NACHT-NTPase
VEIGQVNLTSQSFTALLSLPLIILVEAMSQKLPSFRLSGLFRKGDKREKSKTKTDGVASSNGPAKISTSNTGTSMTGGESSQPETSRILEHQSPKQVMPIGSPPSSVQQPSTMVSEEPLTPTVSSVPTAAADTVASNPPSLPERLWDLAYDGLKAKESKLVAAYEKILSRELKEGDSSSITSGLCENAIEQTNLTTRRSQMEELVQAGLKKMERENKVKQGIGEAMQGVLSVKDIIGSALQPVPHAAIAWTGVCFALQVSLLPKN